MDDARITQAAEILWRGRLECRRMATLPAECRPQTLDEGYAIQDAMVPLAGQAVAGWKIAATSAAGQRHIGVDEPLGGRLFVETLMWQLYFLELANSRTISDDWEAAGRRLEAVAQLSIEFSAQLREACHA